jgi:multiple sugar transport system substrate-binding protein
VIRFPRRRLLAAAAGTGLLAACAGPGTGDGRPVLTQWYHDYGELGVQRAARRYAAGYPGARVEVRWRPGDYARQTATALLTDAGPDVFETEGPTIDEILAGQVADLTAVVGSAAADFHPAVLATKTYRGRIHGIPQAVDMQLLYYRPSLLARTGLRPPGTLDELVAAARALTGPEMRGLFLGNDGGPGALGATPLYAAGSRLVDGGGRLGFDPADPGLAAALGALHALYADGSLLLGAPADWSDPSALVQGLTAMQWSGLWALPQLTAAFGADVGVLPFPPAGPAGQPSVPLGAFACAVNGHSPLAGPAADFAGWLWVRQLADQRDFALSYGLHIPARLSLARSADRLRTGPAARAVRLSVDHGWTRPLRWTDRCDTAWQDALTRIVQDGADPAGQLREVAGIAGAELDRIRTGG